MAWISHPTNYVLWFANGRRSLRPTSRSKPPTTISFACLPSPSPSGGRIKSRRLHMPLPLKFAQSGRRWLRLSSGKLQAAHYLSLQRSWFQKSLGVKSRRRRRAYIRFRTWVYPVIYSHREGPSDEPNTLQVHIRKVKLLKSPKFDLGALLNLHGESNTDEQGQKVEREFKETVLESV